MRLEVVQNDDYDLGFSLQSFLIPPFEPDVVYNLAKTPLLEELLLLQLFDEEGLSEDF